MYTEPAIVSAKVVELWAYSFTKEPDLTTMAEARTRSMITIEYSDNVIKLLGRLEKLARLPMITPEARQALLNKNPKAMPTSLKVTFYEETDYMYAKVTMMPKYSSERLSRAVLCDQLLAAGLTPVGSEGVRLGTVKEIDKWIMFD